MPRLTVAALAVAAFFLVPVPARAHFILQAPANWADQDPSGLPQKSAPCGQADPGTPANPTGIVTPFAPGDAVTVTISETVPHPGHYRVALSTTGQNGLPADPTVTAVGTDQCGMAATESPPVFPVIADGMLEHTAAFSGPQTFTVTLPSDVTCTSNCVLQVVEFMSNHGAPCFYHHCADITIQAGGGGNDAGPVDGGKPPSSGGSGCAVGGSSGSVAGLLAMLGLLAIRRRARR
jgi:MYXO-CTERM domain-containing protein